MGFETTTTILHLFNSNTITGGGAAATIGAFGRNSTNGVKITFPTGTGVSGAIRKTYGSGDTTVWCGFGLYFGAIPPGTLIFFAFVDAGSTQVYFKINSDGTITAFNGANVSLGTTSRSLISTVWYHFETKVKFDNSTGTVDIRINEVSWLSLTGKDTQNTSNAYATQIGFEDISGNPSVASFYQIDDVVVNTNNWLGDVKVREDLPTGVGSHDDGVITGASSSYLATKETPPDSDTTYSSLQNIGDYFLLTYASIPTDSEVIALVPFPFASKSAAGSATFKADMLIGGTQYLGTEQSPSDGSYAYFPDIITTSPATGITWTVTEINALELGVKKIS